MPDVRTEAILGNQRRRVIWPTLKADPDDPTIISYSRPDKYGHLRDKTLAEQKKHGLDRMYWKDKEEAPEYVEGDEYTNHQMELIADKMLREYGKQELCRDCGEIGKETGKHEAIPQFKDGEPVTNEEGQQMYVDFPQLMCENGHDWYKGEGKQRGHGDENPILFEEHLAQRKRREIYTQNGIPDANIVSGIYNRIHPQGRKVNSEKQRKEHGASFYR